MTACPRCGSRTRVYEPLPDGGMIENCHACKTVLDYSPSLDVTDGHWDPPLEKLEPYVG